MEDDPMREEDRVIGKVSYAIPLIDGMSVPFTITYANKSEFLGEQDRVFSGHVGLSYTLPGGKKD